MNSTFFAVFIAVYLNVLIIYTLASFFEADILDDTDGLELLNDLVIFFNECHPLAFFFLSPTGSSCVSSSQLELILLITDGADRLTVNTI